MIKWKKVLSSSFKDPFDSIKWKVANALLKKSDGTVVFKQDNVEVPDNWDQNQVNIVVDKYFRVINGERETSFKQVVSRIVSKITQWALEQKFFANDIDASIYSSELTVAILQQYGAFNSPVWFNLGVPGRSQQASACFILGVEDSIDSIIEYQSSELRIFKGGSGSGANLSNLRSSYEMTTAGAYTSGPLAWMRGLDQYAGAMKSGSATRAAAKMVVLDINHPDIIETKDGRPGFIRCKAFEEKLALDLVKIGYSSSFGDPNAVHKRIAYQNANISLSITDDFMRAVELDGTWSLKSRVDGKVINTYKARNIWREIAEAAWTCGDPGVQFSDTINSWHTAPESGKIRGSNPCSEYLNVDDSACNLCAINLTKFFGSTFDSFNSDMYSHVVRLFSFAQMAICCKADYPTQKIEENSKKLRPIGLNYGNLGALLMNLGYGYDSDDGRAVAARLASLMTANVYLLAAELASYAGAFPEYQRNSGAMLSVMAMHKLADKSVSNTSQVVKKTDQLSQSTWEKVINLGSVNGFFVQQATLMAPLGTISFLMGMDTTGMEPPLCLVSYKQLIDGSTLKLVNSTVNGALKNLGYEQSEIDSITDHISKTGGVVGSIIKERDISVFDCALSPSAGGRSLTPMAHVAMLAAIQPHITCAMSKTVNLPESATVEDIESIYMSAWKMGVKCIALYRDKCKAAQPVLTSLSVKEVRNNPVRLKLPTDVKSKRHKFNIGGTDGYIITGDYDDGSLGEVFLKVGKQGSTILGLLDGFTQLLSISIQYGVPVQKIIQSFVGTKFEPSGMTNNKKIRFSSSIYDYLMKYLDKEYFNGEYTSGDTLFDESVSDSKKSTVEPVKKDTISSPPCNRCGSLTERVGTCHMCKNCGSTTGCGG